VDTLLPPVSDTVHAPSVNTDRWSGRLVHQTAEAFRAATATEAAAAAEAHGSRPREQDEGCPPVMVTAGAGDTGKRT